MTTKQFITVYDETGGVFESNTVHGYIGPIPAIQEALCHPMHAYAGAYITVETGRNTRIYRVTDAGKIVAYAVDTWRVSA